MTALLDRAIVAARLLSLETQDDIARSVPLTAAEEAWLAPSLAQAARGEIAPEGEVAAVLAKHGA